MITKTFAEQMRANRLNKIEQLDRQIALEANRPRPNSELIRRMKEQRQYSINRLNEAA